MQYPEVADKRAAGRKILMAGVGSRLCLGCAFGTAASSINEGVVGVDATEYWDSSMTSFTTT